MPSGRCWVTTMPSSAQSWRGAGTCRPPSWMPSPSSSTPSHDPVSKEAVLIRLAVFVSLRLAGRRTGPGHHRPFPRTLADQLGLDPASLADQLEQLHEQGNALADLLTQ